MAENPITVPLPADLPTNWVYGQTVAPDGSDVGLSQQHGYNYLMEQVNAAQQAAEELGEAFSGLASLDGTGKVPADELPDLDYDPAGSAAAVKEELENDLKTKMQHFGNITGYDTVLAAASALTVDGTFFGDPSSSIYNAADKPPGTTDVQYFVMLDGTAGRRVVLAVGYASSESGRFVGTRDILNGAWLNEWREIATITSEPSTAGARAISAGTTDLTAGSSALATGQIYLVYG